MRHDLCYTVQAEVGVLAWMRHDLCYKAQARLPAEYASRILDDVVRLKAVVTDVRSVGLLRAATAVCMDASCGSRGNTGVHAQEGDVQLVTQGQPDGHVVRLRALKGQVMLEELTGREKVLVFPEGPTRGEIEGRGPVGPAAGFSEQSPVKRLSVG